MNFNDSVTAMIKQILAGASPVELVAQGYSPSQIVTVMSSLLEANYIEFRGVETVLTPQGRLVFPELSGDHAKISAGIRPDFSARREQIRPNDLYIPIALRGKVRKGD